MGVVASVLLVASCSNSESSSNEDMTTAAGRLAAEAQKQVGDAWHVQGRQDGDRAVVTYTYAGTAKEAGAYQSQHGAKGSMGSLSEMTEKGTPKEVGSRYGAQSVTFKVIATDGTILTMEPDKQGIKWKSGQSERWKDFVTGMFEAMKNG